MDERRGIMWRSEVVGVMSPSLPGQRLGSCLANGAEGVDQLVSSPLISFPTLKKCRRLGCLVG